MLGDIKVMVVPFYRYLGLQYDENCRWDGHFENVLTKMRKASHLITRIVRPGGIPPVMAIRSLVVASIASFGFPFWSPTAVQHDRMSTIIVASLRRVLRLPLSTHRLSIFAECGIPTTHHLFDKMVMMHALRCYRLPPSHPSSLLIRSPRPDSRYAKLLTRCEKAWGIDSSTTTRPALRHASAQLQMEQWRSSGRCRDLISLRPDDATGMATYLRYDARPDLRARLRLNRSNLNSSRARRGMIASPQCHCGAAKETPAHLLVCPSYDDVSHYCPLCYAPVQNYYLVRCHLTMICHVVNIVVYYPLVMIIWLMLMIVDFYVCSTQHAPCITGCHRRHGAC